MAPTTPVPMQEMDHRAVLAGVRESLELRGAISDVATTEYDQMATKKNHVGGERREARDVAIQPL